jgi:hypothetical protein
VFYNRIISHHEPALTKRTFILINTLSLLYITHTIPSPCLNKIIQDDRSQATHIKIFVDGCNSIQHDWINKHTISLWLYKSPRKWRHVVTCPSVVFQRSKCKDDFFTSATSVHCRVLPGISFLLNLSECVLGYISRFSCAKQFDNISSSEPLPWHRNSSLGCIKHEKKSECMHRWTRWTFPTQNI